MLKNSTKFQEAFSSLCDMGSSEACDALYPVLEKVTCHMYGVQQSDDINEMSFIKTIQFKDVSETFSRTFKMLTQRILPPCRTELHQQLRREKYISS